MKRRGAGCIEIEADLVAAAIGEADAVAEGRVAQHVVKCESCRNEHSSYQAIDRELGVMREAPVDPQGVAQSRERLARLRGVEAVEDGGEAERLYRDFRAYIEGRAQHLEWPLDLRLVRSPFQRKVLERTAGIPYGAVVSYKRLASDLGQPRAVRAVAQALRWNPVPIAIPCHRVVGASGLLTGYAGGETGRKRQLLTTEGVPVVPAHDDFAIARGAMYMLAPGDSEYCLPSCPSPETLKSGLLTYFGSRTRAEAVGLRPCTSCRPDLHPLHEVN